MVTFFPFRSDEGERGEHPQAKVGDNEDEGQHPGPFVRGNPVRWAMNAPGTRWPPGSETGCPGLTLAKPSGGGIVCGRTFSVSPGGTTTFVPTHQYHLGLWFNDPSVPFKLGCEPGATTPVITPCNGEQHAGIQVLNTSNFPAAAGPLSHVHR
jgi:hypothetical protein